MVVCGFAPDSACSCPEARVLSLVPRREPMKFKFAAFSLSAAVLSASLAFADKTPTSGTIVSMQSVECGSKKKGKTSTSLLCHQYVVRTTTAEYQFRSKSLPKST